MKFSVFVGSVFFLTTACGIATHQFRESGIPAPPLEGVWEIQFQKAELSNLHVPVLISLSAASQEASGVWVSLARPKYIGLYSGDLRNLDLRIPIDHLQPFVGATDTSSDTVRIVLNPGPAHGAVVLLGSYGNEQFSGRWYETAYAGGTHGTFTMTRVQTRLDLARIIGRLERAGHPQQ